MPIRTTGQLAALTGLNDHVILHWANQGVIVPEPLSAGGGPGSRRLFNVTEQSIALALVGLSGAVTVPVLVVIAQALREALGGGDDEGGWAGILRVRRALAAAQAGEPAWLLAQPFARPSGERAARVETATSQADLAAKVAKLAADGAVIVVDLTAALAPMRA